jgi:hypothetical protein
VAALAALVVWNRQLAAIYNSEALARRNEAISLDQLAEAQVDAVYRKAMAAQPWLPRPLWLLLYDNLKGVWLDEGPRSLQGVIDLGNEPRELPEVLGHNWYRPLIEGDVTYRRSRGRRSWLRVPIRTPAPFVVVVRARSDMGDDPLEMELELNGRSLGRAALTTQWGESTFEIPEEAVRSGWNDLALGWSTTPRAADPEHHGKDAAASVDWVRFRRTERMNGPV